MTAMNRMTPRNSQFQSVFHPANEMPMNAMPMIDVPIEELDLSERPRNCLKRAQINTIGELIEKTEDDLLAITNF